MGPAPRKPGPLSPGRDGGKVAVWSGQQRIGLRALSHAPALPGPSLPPEQPPASDLQGLVTVTLPWEDGGARFLLLLLPPAPRAETVARETGLAALGGSAPSMPRASLLPGPPSPSVGGGAKGQRGGGEPLNLPAGQGRDTRGTKTPGTTTASAAAATGSASPEARPLVGSCHYPGYGPSLRSTDLSLPPLWPATRLLRGAEVRLPRSCAR